jgi:hypothetical protein
MTVTIAQKFDCTQRQMVVDIAEIIYRTHGCKLPKHSNNPVDPTNLLYLYGSQHPTEQGCLAAAEYIFEMFYGDSPTYEDDPDEL